MSYRLMNLLHVVRGKIIRNHSIFQIKVHVTGRTDGWNSSARIWGNFVCSSKLFLQLHNSKFVFVVHLTLGFRFDEITHRPKLIKSVRSSVQRNVQACISFGHYDVMCDPSTDVFTKTVPIWQSVIQYARWNIPSDEGANTSNFSVTSEIFFVEVRICLQSAKIVPH